MGRGGRKAPRLGRREENKEERMNSELLGVGELESQSESLLTIHRETKWDGNINKKTVGKNLSKL